MLIINSQRYIKEANQYEIEESSKMLNLQVEVLYSIFNIKMFGIENSILKEWNEMLDNVICKTKKKEDLYGKYSALEQILQVISPLIILTISIDSFYNGNLSLGELVAFYSLSGSFFGICNSLFQTYGNFLLANGYMERVGDILYARQEENGVSKTIHELNGDIVLKNIYFSYTKSSRKVLENISMHIERGNKIAIVGESGSGKSTLSKILLGIYEPVEGEVYYDGASIKTINKVELRKNIGVVPQDTTLFNKSIFDNIKMNRDVTENEIFAAAKAANISEDIDKLPLKYETLVSELGMNFSGGQRQRIALARALVSNPKIIVLDEATSSLDSINEQQVSRHFREKGCTCIVISHRLSTVMDSDKIYVMDKGKIIEEGTHKELITLEGKYYELFNSNFAS